MALVGLVRAALPLGGAQTPKPCHLGCKEQEGRAGVVITGSCEQQVQAVGVTRPALPEATESVQVGRETSPDPARHQLQGWLRASVPLPAEQAWTSSLGSLTSFPLTYQQPESRVRPQ